MSNLLAAFGCGLGAVLAWTLQGQVAQFVQTSSGFERPLFITWLAQSATLLLLPLQLLLLSRFSCFSPSAFSQDHLEEGKLLIRGGQESEINKDEPKQIGQDLDNDHILINHSQIYSRKEGESENDENRDFNENGDQQRMEEESKQQSASAKSASNDVDRVQTTQSPMLKYKEILTSSVERFCFRNMACSPWQLLRMVCWIACLYFTPNAMWYYGLQLSSVTEVTAVSNTGFVFGYIFSVILMNESITTPKITAVLVCMAGVVMMTFISAGEERVDAGLLGGNITSSSPTYIDLNGTNYENEQDSTNTLSPTPSNHVLGNLISLLASVIYGLTEVLMKKYAFTLLAVPGYELPNISHYSNMLMGFIGLFTFTCLWPILVFELLYPNQSSSSFFPPDTETWLTLLITAVASLLYNAFFVLAIALSTPLFAGVSVLLTIPAAAIADWIVRGLVPGPWMIAGTLMILIGFGLQFVRDPFGFSWTIRKVDYEQVKD